MKLTIQDPARQELVQGEKPIAIVCNYCEMLSRMEVAAWGWHVCPSPW